MMYLIRIADGSYELKRRICLATTAYLLYMQLAIDKLQAPELYYWPLWFPLGWMGYCLLLLGYSALVKSQPNT